MQRVAVFGVNHAMRTQDAIAQCDRRSGRSHTLTGAPPRAPSRVGADAELSRESSNREFWTNIVMREDLFCAWGLLCAWAYFAIVCFRLRSSGL
jgi:hypothetical protein